MKSKQNSLCMQEIMQIVTDFCSHRCAHCTGLQHCRPASKSPLLIFYEGAFICRFISFSYNTRDTVVQLWSCSRRGRDSFKNFGKENTKATLTSSYMHFLHISNYCFSPPPRPCSLPLSCNYSKDTAFQRKSRYQNAVIKDFPLSLHYSLQRRQ